MKKVIIYLTIIASTISCSQKKQKPMIEITAKNIVEQITSQVKHYPKEPFYQIYVANSLCVYELLVNDFPVHKQFEYAQLATPIYINYNILKSGKQKVTIRLYPAHKEFNWRNGEFFSPETTCRISLEVNDNAKGLPVDGNIELQKIEMPTVIRMAGEKNDFKILEFAGKGQKYFEHSFYFDAQVPYVNTGWSEGQDLRKLDQKELEKEVVKFYLARKDETEKQNIDAIAKQAFAPLKEQFVAEYNDKERIKKGWNEYIAPYKSSVYKFQLLENYKMVFYGDGKMVTLEQKSTDVRLRGKSALWALFIDAEGTERAHLNGISLIVPQGKSINQLQAIR